MPEYSFIYVFIRWDQQHVSQTVTAEVIRQKRTKRIFTLISLSTAVKVYDEYKIKLIQNDKGIFKNRSKQFP